MVTTEVTLQREEFSMTIIRLLYNYKVKKKKKKGKIATQAEQKVKMMVARMPVLIHCDIVGRKKYIP